MRILAILTVVALVACSKGDTPAVDSTAMTSTMAAAPAPLTAADVDGSWNGVSMGETSDSVTLRWTTKNIDGTTGTLMIEGQKDAITFTRTFDADSMIASSTPYANPADAKGPKLLFRSVGRLKGERQHDQGYKFRGCCTFARRHEKKVPRQRAR
ncbi:hypothetical protein [Gemmatimonas sp.]|uniref:hypothetical protein n=1 Tax=Gemmatimonas sp. TaxID=1962908 RepID=UPI002869FF49|nr:hypothetical protein [Gemmatimonas sp.]